MSSEKHPMTVEAALILIRRPGWTGNEGDIAIAAATLTENCEIDPRIKISDMLLCLEIPGVVAEFGARSLYVRTGRDGLGWAPAVGGRQFVTEKEDWIAYLTENGIDF